MELLKELWPMLIPLLLGAMGYGALKQRVASLAGALEATGKALTERVAKIEDRQAALASRDELAAMRAEMSAGFARIEARMDRWHDSQGPGAPARLPEVSHRP